MRALRAHLLAHLFLDAPRERSRLAGWEKGVLVAGLLALAVVLQLARLGWSSSLNTIWAEDGHIFLQEAIVAGPLHALAATYGTYLVLAPRLIGELASLLPLQQGAAAISILSAATVALSGFVVWLASAGHIRSRHLRAALVILVILTPVSGVEAVDSAAYVLWYMLFASFWILLWRPASWGGTIFAAAFVLVTALSTPGVWFFAPLAILRAIAVRDRKDLLIVCAYAAGALAQIPVVMLSADVVAAPVWSTHDLWTATMQRLVTETPLGLHLAGNGWKLVGWPLILVVAGAGLAALLYGWRGVDRHARWIAGLAVPIAAVMFVVSIYQRGVAEQMVWLADTYNYLGSRYVIVPSLLLVSALFVLFDRGREQRADRTPTARIRLALLAVLAIAVVSSFWVRDLVIRGVPWEEAVATAEQECEARQNAGTLAGEPEILIPTAPPGWAIELPCSEVASTR